MEIIYSWLGFIVFWAVITIGLFGVVCIAWLALTINDSIFGYVLVKADEHWDISTKAQRIAEGKRWFAGFEDLDIIWSYLNRDISVDRVRWLYAQKRRLTEFGDEINGQSNA